MKPDVHGFSPVLTSFVGRADAVRDVTSLLGSERLVTLLGPGGVGKTRLAAEVARQVAPRYADGVWLAELAATSDPVRVAATVALAMGVPDRPGTPAISTLSAALARRQVLIVLDNCEHLVSAVAELSPAATEMPGPLVFTDSAAAKVKELVDEEGNPELKLRVFVQGGGCSGFQYGFTFDEAVAEDDTQMSKNGVTLLIDAMSLQYLMGAEIDYKEDLQGAQFVIKNPNATSTCGCGSSFSA